MLILFELLKRMEHIGKKNPTNVNGTLFQNNQVSSNLTSALIRWDKVHAIK